MAVDSQALDRILIRVSKPARYTGGEWNSVVKDWDSTPLRVCVCFPDVYEIGMSNNALPIFYDLLNRPPDVLCERVFTPWPDMATALRQARLSLFSLETRHPLHEFDVLGFSLAYEQTYTNVLETLDLGGIPLLSQERDERHPLVVAGGHCALNPEPIADFVDVFGIGEGEDMLLDLVELVRRGKTQGWSRQELLRRCLAVPGLYVPRFYDVSYRADGTIASIKPNVPEAPARVVRQYMAQVPPVVTRPVVPNLGTIQDRAAIEIKRGCPRGCRFCQAGMITRPTRERSHEEILQAADELLQNTGYEELALLSLSSADFPGIDKLVAALAQRYGDQPLNISLPSLRIDAFSVELTDALSSGRGRKSGFTFAPEAGSARLREVINKAVPEEQIEAAARVAFKNGWQGIKLYFMIGLPTETEDDVLGILRLCRRLLAIGKEELGHRPRVKASVGVFVPKPHTPFQWMPQDSQERARQMYGLLRDSLKRAGAQFAWTEPEEAFIEAVLSRGDRRLGPAIRRAWELGCRFDSWSEHFQHQTWLRAFQETGVDPAFYAYRERALDEALPWDHIDCGVTKGYLRQEYARTLKGAEMALAAQTGDCRCDACNGCGLQKSDVVCQDKFAELILSKKEAAKVLAKV